MIEFKSVAKRGSVWWKLPYWFKCDPWENLFELSKTGRSSR